MIPLRSHVVVILDGVRIWNALALQLAWSVNPPWDDLRIRGVLSSRKLWEEGKRPPEAPQTLAEFPLKLVVTQVWVESYKVKDSNGAPVFEVNLITEGEPKVIDDSEDSFRVLTNGFVPANLVGPQPD